VLTDTGTARLRELKAGLRHVEDGLLEALDDDDRSVLRTLLQRLATTLAPANPCEIAREFADGGPVAHVRPRRRHAAPAHRAPAERSTTV
jgi:hypothetical protein